MGDLLALELRLRREAATDAWTDEQRQEIAAMQEEILQAFTDAVAAATGIEEDWEDVMHWMASDEDASEDEDRA